MPLSYRPYQLDAQVAVRDAWAIRLPGDPWPMIVICTGGGKTETALQLVWEALEAGERVVWLAHRDELVSEPAERFCRYFPEKARDVGIVQADRDQHGARALFASVQTLAVDRRLEAILQDGHVDLVVVDEAHHSPSRTHKQVIRRLLAGGGRAMALTATPDRDDGLDLGEDWEIVYSYTILDAMAEGWLVPAFAAVAPLTGLDRVLAQAAGRRDYDDAELGAALMLEGIVEHTVAQLAEVHTGQQIPREHGSEERALQAKGRGVLVFTATVAQAEATATALCADGWNARAISGETPKDLRKRLIAGFRDGRVEVLCNAAVLTEGTDLPRASCLVLARPTKSWGLYVQMVGRGLRLFCPALERTDPRLNALDPAYAAAGGKRECLIIDLAGATADHSLYAAAVLIGASRCPESPNGAHIPEATVDGKGRCTACKRKFACIVGALAGGAGGHEWHPQTFKCKHCDRPQCPLAPEGRHAMIRVADAKPCRKCLYCEAEVADPLSSMYDREVADREAPAAAAWLRLRGLAPTVCAVNLEPHGALFVVEDDAAHWRPYWLPERARKARPITPRAVPPDQVRWMVDDLVRRATRIADQHGGFASRREREDRRAWMTDRAVSLGLARRA